MRYKMTVEKYVSIIIFYLLITFLNCSAQQFVNIEKLHSNFALSENRVLQDTLFHKQLNNVFNSPLTKINESKWTDLFNEVTLAYYKSTTVYNAVKTGLDQFNKTKLKFRYSLLETIFTLYPEEFTDDIKKILTKTNDPLTYGYCANILFNSGNKEYTSQYFAKDIRSKFADNLNDPVIQLMLYKFEAESDPEFSRPNLSELLSFKFQDGMTIIYSLQRKQRTFSGITIVKRPDGKFVRNNKQQIFYIRQLALSASNLPSYLNGGNTPQGIFSIVGMYVSPTEEIGPTPVVLTRIPFEKPADIFYHRKNINSWQERDYRNLLPKSWRNYFPMMEAYLCGKIGRRLIVMHGSVDNPELYKSKDYFPLTPTRGCLSATEIWSAKTGQCLKSDQAKLINAFYSTGRLEGYLVVVEIDNQEKDVTFDEVLPFINEAEKLSAKY